ncbi:MAG TPA: ABC transporter ATP-binding protein [Mobilitalea sp.]|nr:ABC transporter ATP-binding protein [Mobilitalea sp.]
MLELFNVKKYYKDNRAVDGISFCMENGEILGLIGANGAGKTTTLSMIATLSKPDSGNIYYNGQDIVKNPAILRNDLGYIPQDIALYTSLTGLDNLQFWGKSNHIRGKRLKEQIIEVSRIIDFDINTLRKKVSSYSGGMKRRLNIGVALLHEPRLIIMDEPTVGLDVEARNQVLDTVLELKKKGAGIIYAGHYMEEMERICDKICVIDQGRCILFGNKTELLKGNKSLEQLYLEAIGSNREDKEYPNG